MMPLSPDQKSKKKIHSNASRRLDVALLRVGAKNFHVAPL